MKYRVHINTAALAILIAGDEEGGLRFFDITGDQPMAGEGAW